ncbi:MAG: choice-of-anchor J domain-containing protein, partial [Chlamydiia bacterium]|nr:choice-of-anchor J domain-containing protein [Chlamydiia bacterium]
AFGNADHVSTAVSTVDATTLTNVRFEFDMRQSYTYNVTYGWARVLINGTDYAIDLNGDSVWNASTANADPFQTLAFDLSAYAGTVFSISIELAAKYNQTNYGSSYTYGDDMYVDNIKVYQPAPNDLAMSALYSPNSGIAMTNAMTIEALVYNNGTATQSGYTASYSIDGGATFITQTIASSISAGDYATIVFTTTADLSTVGTHNIILAVANAGDADSNNDTISTDFINMPIPYNNDFEAYANNSIPDYWTVLNSTGNVNAYAKIYGYASGAHSGVSSMHMYNQSSTGSNVALIASLPIVHSGVSTLKIKFWLKGEASDLIIGVMTDPNDSSTFVGVDTLFLPPATYGQYAVMFDTYTGNGKYIAFKHGMNTTYDDFYIDDIELYQPVPNDLSLLSVGGFTSEIDMGAKNISISVYNNGTAAQSGYDVSFSIDGGATYITENIATTINPEDTLDYTFTATATLVSGITEVMAVVSNTGDAVNGNDSAFVTRSNFSMPYTTSFEDAVSYQMPDGWSLLNTTGNPSTYAYAYDYAYYSHTGTFHIKMYNYNTTTNAIMAVMPKDNTAGGVASKVLKFWARGGTNQNLIIGVLTDAADTATFVGVDTVFTPSFYSEYSIDLSTYTGSGTYVAFKHGMDANYDSYYIDDIHYFEPLQNDLMASSIEIPAQTICGSATFEFDAIFSNNGVLTQTNIPVSAVITDPNGVSTTLTAVISSLAKTESDTATFSSVDVTVAGVYNVVIYSSLTGEEDTSNDTLTGTFELLAPLALDFVDGFDDLGANWDLAGLYVSSQFGKTTYGLYKNFYSGNSGSAFTNKKVGPITADASLVFSYHIKDYGSVGAPTSLDDDKFYFLISNDCGTTYDTLYTVDSTNHTATANWTDIQIPLTNYVGDNVIIGISGQQVGGGDFYFAVDDFGVATPIVYELGNDTTICSNDSLMLGMDYVSGYTYMWTVDGDTLANTNYQISPDSAGVYTVEVTSPLGQAFDTLTITMNAATACSLTGLANVYCSNEASVALVGLPANGLFSGNGVTGSSFDPAEAGYGMHTVTYTYTDANGCITTADSAVEINLAPMAVMTPASDICEGDSILLSAITAAADGVFFSMYIEGSSNNKALEIYNGTSSTINLDNYVIRTNYNGNPWSGLYSFPAGATLDSGDVFVIANEQADAAILAVADDSLAYNAGGYIVGFNGDDVRALYQISGSDTTMIDIIGMYDMVDPGSGWEVAGVANATKDHSLIRKDNVFGGNTNWALIAGTDVASSEYIVNAKDDYTGIGSHTVNPAAPSMDTYLWSTGETTSSFYATPAATTTYTVTVSNTLCSEVDSITVTVNAYPMVDLGADVSFKWTAGFVTLDAGYAGMDYTWSTGEATQTVTYNQSNFAAGTDTTVYVVVDNNGCTGSDTIRITVIDDVSINGALDNVNVSVYPNPNDGQFTLAINGAEGEFNMEIVNLAGQVVYSQIIEANNNFVKDVDVSEFATGVYYIKLSNKQGVKINKLIIK